jgi:hypothetical protein
LLPITFTSELYFSNSGRLHEIKQFDSGDGVEPVFLVSLVLLYGCFIFAIPVGFLCMVIDHPGSNGYKTFVKFVVGLLSIPWPFDHVLLLLSILGASLSLACAVTNAVFSGYIFLMECVIYLNSTMYWMKSLA